MRGHSKPQTFDDLDEAATTCARCGYCNAVCCTYQESRWESASPRGRLALIRKLWRESNRYSLPDALIRQLYGCTLCSKCVAACPLRIDLRSIWLTLRRKAVESGQAPQSIVQMCEAVTRWHNVFSTSNDERAEWVDYAADAPPHGYRKQHAEVVYYVGCVSSFSATVQSIPSALAKLLDLAGVDFAILGGEEWCCGFPLIAAGERQRAASLIAHNIERVRDLGARRVVFNCPSCYHAWKHAYNPQGIELLHETQFLYRLLAQGDLKTGELRCSVAYHDPCDLGRNSGVYDEPRALLCAIPGLKLMELVHNRHEAFCCGGGGDLEMVAPELVQRIASRLIAEAHRSRAERLVVACPQCKRAALMGVEASRSPLQVVDIAELLLEACSCT